MTAAAATGRVELVDALRGLALLAVVSVNWVGYVSEPGNGPIFPPKPLDAGAAQLSMWMISAFLQAKGIMLLSFLFGYSQVLSMRARGPAAREARVTRLQKLLLLGLLHGLFIYAGDVLTGYALCGFIMLDWSTMRLGPLVDRLKALIALSLVLTLLGTVLEYSMGGRLSSDPGLTDAASWRDWLSINGGQYLASLVGFVLMGLPDLLAMMVAGLIAGRLRLFSRAGWRPRLAGLARRLLLPVLGFSAVLSALQWRAWVAGDVAQALLLATPCNLVAALLLLGLVPALALWLPRHARVMAWLAGAGRISLTIYLGSSLVSLLLFSGVGAGLQLGTTTAWALAWTWWGLGLVAGRGLSRKGWRLPLEQWLSRPWAGHWRRESVR